MIVCRRCKYENNNYQYCCGCGRRLSSESEEKFEKLPEESPRFLDEVIDIIEAKSALSDFDLKQTPRRYVIDLKDISKSEGILLIGNEQWKTVGDKEKGKNFLSEFILIYFLTFFTLMVSVAAGIDKFEMILKCYTVSFLLISFVFLFLLPYFFGFTIVAFLYGKYALCTKSHEFIRGRAKELFLLFIFSAIPSLFIFPFLFSIISLKVSKRYFPLALKMSEIDYLEKIGRLK